MRKKPEPASSGFFIFAHRDTEAQRCPCQAGDHSGLELSDRRGRAAPRN